MKQSKTPNSAELLSTLRDGRVITTWSGNECGLLGEKLWRWTPKLGYQSKMYVNVSGVFVDWHTYDTEDAFLSALQRDISEFNFRVSKPCEDTMSKQSEQISIERALLDVVERLVNHCPGIDGHPRAIGLMSLRSIVEELHKAGLTIRVEPIEDVLPDVDGLLDRLAALSKPSDSASDQWRNADYWRDLIKDCERTIRTLSRK